MNKVLMFSVLAMLSALNPGKVSAQMSAADSVPNCAARCMTRGAASGAQAQLHGNKLSVGGYGEIALSRNFYSDSPFKYSSASAHKDDPSHGRFDLPHAVIYLGYDFGHGWTFNTEIEFEHGGSGGAIEKEGDEGGEWESETEKGGEVELEQFWIQKSFSKAFNVRAGHIIVPFGLTNAHHEPLNFFTVYRSEGENTILPSTWHQTGVSLWGRMKDWKYEVQVTSGLDAMMFDRQNWIHYGANSPYEFEVANKYGFLARLDNYSVKGLRLGLSGYFGETMNNTFPNDNNKYKDVKGSIALGAFDFTYKSRNWIARGNIDYGYIGDSKTINDLKANQSSKTSPYRKAAFGKNAVAASVEAGYNILSLFNSTGNKKSPSHVGEGRGGVLYFFGHYEYYDSYIHGLNQYTQKQIFAAGVNYMPLPQICVKAEYKYRKMKAQFNDEPALNIGICYQGFFL